MIEKYKLAILLTCHNRKQKTLSCLKSLFESKIDSQYVLSVFLVDDGSTDGTGEAVKESYPSVTVIQGNGNLFWNRGMHLAWKKALEHDNYDYYIWLNDDVIILPEGISTLLSTSKRKSNSIICGTMKDSNQNEPTYGGRLTDGKLLVPNGQEQRCDYINGNLVLIPKSVYDIIGNLDPMFPHAIGDFDYGLRASKKGVKSYVAPDYLGICERRSSLADWCLPEVGFWSRIKSLYSPLGNSHPYYFFRFEVRHYGMIKALKHFLSIHFRVVYPKFYLWKN